MLKHNKDHKLIQSLYSFSSISALVKDLLWNSLDANASQIHCEINFAQRSLAVTDNGRGSKTLDRIGEAPVASCGRSKGKSLFLISSISKICISTKLNYEIVAKVIDPLGGVSMGSTNGKSDDTVVGLRDIFKITSIRRNCINQSAEKSDLRSFIDSVSLSHPFVTFKLSIIGSKPYQISKLAQTEAMDGMLCLRAWDGTFSTRASVRQPILISGRHNFWRK